MLKSIKLVLATATVLAVIAPSSVSVAAAETAPIEVSEHSNEIRLIKNDLYVAFEKELLELTDSDANTFSTVDSLKTDTFSTVDSLKTNTFSTSMTSGSTISKAQFFDLMEKYDGAEVTVMAAQTKVYSEKFVRGGLNTYATTTSGLNFIRTTLNRAATAVALGSATSGFAGPVGLLIVLGGAPIVVSLRAGASVASDWIQAGKTRGGVRVTYTQAYPISSLTSTAEAIIK